MATTIILKNSSVAGKVPDPSVLQAGELGVNLKDQKLYSKDADGNVFELGRGSTDSGGSGDKPGSPEVGDLYYDTDLDVLLVWNGSEWETVGSVTSVNGKTGEVVLEASDVGALAPGDDISELNNDAGYLTSADLPDDTLWLQTTGAIYPKDLSNNVQVGGTAADPNISLGASGSATFLGDVVVGEDPSTSADNNGLMFRASGGVIARRANDSDNVFAGFKEVNPSETSSIKADGSATFKGDVAIGDSTTFRDNAAIIAALPEKIRETFKSALNKWEKATPYVPEDPSTLPADETLREAIIRITTAGKVNLNSDGSATFANGATTFFNNGGAKFANGNHELYDNGAAVFAVSKVRINDAGTILVNTTGWSDSDAKIVLSNTGKITAVSYDLEALPALP